MSEVRAWSGAPRRAGLLMALLAAVTGGYASVASAASAPPPIPGSTTNCGGSLTLDQATVDDPNQMNYKFNCDYAISSYTLIVSRGLNTDSTVDDFSSGGTVVDSAGNPVTAGVWDLAPDVVGAFATTGATPEVVDTSLTATTQAFDPAVSSGTGDLWQAALGAPLTVSPVVVPPGHSATIPVTITPTGTPGSRVSGVLYLDDDSLYSLYGGLSPDANTVAAIPYSYRIGG